MNNKVTIELDNIDEAIVALGAVAQVRKAAGAASKRSAIVAPPAAQAGAAGAEAPPAEPVAPASTSRKPRADKGQARGPYKKGSEAAAPENRSDAPRQEGANVMPAPAAEEPIQEAAAAGGPATSEQTATPAAAPEAAAAPTDKDCQDAIQKVFASKPSQRDGIAAAQECLQRVGAARVRDIKPELRAKFIEACNEKLK